MKSHKHLFPIIDAMADQAVRDTERGRTKISCASGCAHCCHLLVEVAWEEAEALADWIEAQPADVQTRFRRRLKTHAERVRALFRRWPTTARFVRPSASGTGFPSFLFDRYFYDEDFPCPFLEQGRCAAYSARPTPCRLHFVSSPAQLCSREAREAKGYRVPRAIEKLREEAGPVIRSVQRDPRWGHLGIMVESVLKIRARQRTRREARSVCGSCGLPVEKVSVKERLVQKSV